ncbi:RNA polymerase, sigma-24 subunit, ECF subfamily [Methyloglobulus morosus KoM1]|uniref:RNA polymerase, sigma-24 subunit, ECF subfamily n=1 Tax=Methyloglobulus morosus KoM1 TaxID=1116472 RepID=V5BDX6_9GAMM|nr:sigma-70 family RNA polymerase sigma factor [Methyloglobulus morosus]ESS71510.1 RNA polymerase, sigma-24 subunit, ECF subfamily [Methyloglobulus morosus KoM1]
MSKYVDEAQGVALLKRIAAKDRKAFEAFYYLYAEGFGRFLMKMLKHQEWVDEAVNDVMLTVWQSAGSYDPEKGRLSTWLFGIAHKKGLKLLERNGRYREESLEDYPEEADSDEDGAPELYNTDMSPNSQPERVVMGWELGDAMSWAFSKLSADHLAVIDLCFAEGYSYQEIADIVGCPINTVKTRLFHARKRLAELLARKGFSLPEQVKVTI